MRNVTAILSTFLACAALGAADSAQLAENFDGAPVKWATGRGEKGKSISSAAVVPAVGFGNSAGMVWKYDFSMDEPGGNIYIRLRPRLALPGQPAKFSFRIRGDKSGLPLSYRLRDASGRIWQLAIGKIDFEGWKEFTLDIKPGGFAWGGTVRADKGFTFPLQFEEFLLDYSRPAEKNTGELVIDDLLFQEEPQTREEF